MKQNETDNGQNDFNRRDFLRNASFGSLMMLMGGIPLEAQEKTPAGAPKEHNADESAPLTCGVIGCGAWGRDILHTLAAHQTEKGTHLAPVTAICDIYEPFLKRAKEETAPNAQTYTDYHKLLEQTDVQGVIVATPTHLHKEIVIAALKAGKHVYCEAPLAATVEDARAIAQAAKDAVKVNFQTGLQARSDPQKMYVYREFVRVGAFGKFISARSHWHKRDSWRQAAKTPAREKELNWRLDKTLSPGLMGEIGVHQLDLVSWYLGKWPAAVTGYGANLCWDDGREVADAVNATFEYPSKVIYQYEANLGNSFETDGDMIFGNYAALMVHGNKSWLFKESDSPQFGWELYATKEKFRKEVGIVLSADATKSVKAVAKPGPDDEFKSTPLHYSLAAFVKNSNETINAVKGFTDSYGADAEGLGEYLNTKEAKKSRLPAAGYLEGFQATVAALKANEAIVKRQKIAFQKEWFDI